MASNQKSVGPSESVSSEFQNILKTFRDNLKDLFSQRADLNEVNLSRGMPPYILREVRSCSPMSVFIPEQYGGRGMDIKKGMALLSEASYHSLPLSLLMGINGGLFLQPIAKYGQEKLKKKIFTEYLEEKKLGGLMITEPDFGTDALKMETGFLEENKTYSIEGTKHWAGLTGWADYWIIAARKQNGQGTLGRDINLFVCNGDDDLTVEERYENLGLEMLPYGRNKIHANVPKSHRLEPKSSGLRMMQDLLHRSRYQFPGMGMGFLQRIFKEAVDHCQEREIGGQNLIEYDQVQHRLKEIQTACTACSAMCVHTSENAGNNKNLHDNTIEANSIKAVITDLMQKASQSYLQLAGADGYRKDHFAGRAMVDSRPFQIFEGSNDVLYDQVANSLLKSLKRSDKSNLTDFLSEYDLTSGAIHHLNDTFDFEFHDNLPQRQMVAVGKAVSKLVSMNLVEELGDREFPEDLVENCLTTFKNWVNGSLLPDRDETPITEIVEASQKPTYWLQFV